MSEKENVELTILKYLSYVTLRDAWAYAKTFLGFWLFFSVFVIGFSVFFEFGLTKTESLWSVIPKPIWFVLTFALIAWFLRGEEIRIVFVWPSSFKLWLLFTTYVAVIVFCASVLPYWSVVLIVLAVYFGGFILATLAEIGKKNFQKLSEQANKKNV